METKEIKEMSLEDLKAMVAQKEAQQKKKKQKEQKEFVIDKDNFLKHSSSKFLQLQSEMRQLKALTISKANELYERMYLMEGKEPKEVKSFTMKNEDDTVKITVERQELLEFNEQAGVHINAIKDIFQKKFEARNKAMYGYINDLLIKNTKGEYDPRLITKVKRRALEYNHTDILVEVEKLEECRRVTGTSLYCRCYIRDDQKKWQDVTLQFSAL